MLVAKNAKVCVTPNAKRQREPMEYRLRWVPDAKFLHWPCTFHIICAHFICVGYPARTQFAVEYNLNLVFIVKYIYISPY